eukprot:CAMPEP_0175733368 /NCGR_PEP_ID=MMETSP0097-20121207/51840_1 /TAXON_ID=311494 /ORGANISM="Alexandrium monilatum, Strain CCMP3105" /LENGTH=89 /DNA_ID=CAMNT_0017041373 /DNA_START=278 /DNA_END=544 /DNA_ORIENTATION=-
MQELSGARDGRAGRCGGIWGGGRGHCCGRCGGVGGAGSGLGRCCGLRVVAGQGRDEPPDRGVVPHQLWIRGLSEDGLVMVPSKVPQLQG